VKVKKKAPAGPMVYMLHFRYLGKNEGGLVGHTMGKKSKRNLDVTYREKFSCRRKREKKGDVGKESALKKK